jgi:hypothetical protein
MYLFNAPRLCTIQHWADDSKNEGGCEVRTVMTMKSGAQRNKSYYFLHISGRQMARWWKTVQLLI